MKHEVIISSEQFEDYERLLKLENEGGAIVTLRVSTMGYYKCESYYISEAKTKTHLWEFTRKMTHNDELRFMSVRDFRKLRRKLKANKIK